MSRIPFHTLLPTLDAGLGDWFEILWFVDKSLLLINGNFNKNYFSCPTTQSVALSCWLLLERAHYVARFKNHDFRKYSTPLESICQTISQEEFFREKVVRDTKMFDLLCSPQKLGYLAKCNSPEGKRKRLDLIFKS